MRQPSSSRPHWCPFEVGDAVKLPECHWELYAGALSDVTLRIEALYIEDEEADSQASVETPEGDLFSVAFRHIVPA